MIAFAIPAKFHAADCCRPRAQVYISTGAGARVALPDRKVAAVIAAMRPSLRAAKYDAAVEQARISHRCCNIACPVHPCARRHRRKGMRILGSRVAAR